MSKFDKLFEARETAEDKNTPSANKNENRKQKSVKASTSKVQITEPISVNDKTQKQRGRPKAKRSDPEFIGFTTYIRKDTHLKVKIALLQEGSGRELSELVENLLSTWVKNK